jgi:hypothetical protein
MNEDLLDSLFENDDVGADDGEDDMDVEQEDTDDAPEVDRMSVDEDEDPEDDGSPGGWDDLLDEEITADNADDISARVFQMLTQSESEAQLDYNNAAIIMGKVKDAIKDDDEKSELVDGAIRVITDINKEESGHQQETLIMVGKFTGNTYDAKDKSAADEVEEAIDGEIADESVDFEW